MSSTVSPGHYVKVHYRMNKVTEGIVSAIERALEGVRAIVVECSDGKTAVITNKDISLIFVRNLEGGAVTWTLAQL
jgi:hypothetical protein